MTTTSTLRGLGLLALLATSASVDAQTPLSLRQGFEGKVGHVGAAGTFRTGANGTAACDVGTASSLSISGIPAGATIRSAVLYWAGSGNTPDEWVRLDGATWFNDPAPQTDSYAINADNTIRFFQGVADATAAVAAKRNGTYTLDRLTVENGDVTATTPDEPYCTVEGVVKAWALHVVYEDPSMTRRSRVNLYDGLAHAYGSSLDATIDQFETPAANESAVSYVLWEGDPGTAGTDEAARFTPAGAATVTLDGTDPFNYTPRSLAGSEGGVVYGVDYDRYDVSGGIPVGTTEAGLTVAAAPTDFVLLSSVVLRMHSLASDLAVSLSTTDATPGLGGETVVYVDLDNLGPDATAAAEVAIDVPAGYVLVAADAPAGTSYAAGVWTIAPGVAVGGGLRLPLTLRAETEAPVTVTASATAFDRVEDSLANNDAALGLDAAPEADLSVGVTADAPAALPGETVTFTVALANDGPTDATGVALTGLLSGDLAPTGVTVGAGTFDDASGVWTVGPIAAGDTVYATVTATVTGPAPGALTAEVTASDQPDPDSAPANGDAAEDDQDAATVTPNVADLALDMVVDEPAPAVGDEVTYTITVTNQQGTTATDVQVSAPFVARADTVAVLGAVPSTGGYDGTIWTVGSLAPGESATLTVTVRLDQDLIAYTALAEIAHADQTDVDSTPYDGSTADDDDAAATATTGGASTAGEGGLESNGSMAQALAGVLYGRRQEAARRADLGLVAAPLVAMSQARVGGASALVQAVPVAGPAGSQAVEVSPTDLLPVTNATDVVAADYLRADGRRVGALFATTTAPGEVYEHTKPVCDRLRGGRLDGVELVEVAGRPFVLTRLVQADGSVDYAVSFVVYDGLAGRTVDSRFLLSDYDTDAMRGDADVLNVQVWGPSREYAAALVAGVLAEVGGPLAFRNEGATAPALPTVFVQSGRYEGGRLVLDLYNAAGATSLRLSGGTMTRAEGGRAQAFARTVDVPAGSAEAPTVTVAVETGPLFDAAFFVETDRSAAPDRLYLADGTWGVALDPASDVARLDAFEVEPEAGGVAEGVRRVERAARAAGRTDSWATLFRTLAPGGLTADLSGYRYVEFEAAGSGEARLLLQQAAIATSDHFGATVRLTPEPRRHRVYFEDLQLADGTRGFDGLGVATLSLTTWTGGDAPFALAVRDVRFGGAEGDEAGAPAEPALLAPAPNPFSAATRVRFELAEAGPATLRVFDVLGREVARPVDAELAAGRHTATVDGRGLAAGVYVVRLDVGGQALTRRLTLAR